MKIRLVTVVWGREYVDTFVRAGLRSLLSKGNVPDLASAHDVIYTIYTTRPDADVLDEAPAFRRLRESVDIRLSLFDPSEIDTTNYGDHGVLWRRAIDLARRNGEVLFFIIPDLFYAKGTLVSWAERFVEGKRAVFTVGPQVVLETVLPELERRFPGSAGPCDLDRDQLLDLMERHLHPLHAAMERSGHRRPAHPEYDLRVVPKWGLVIREMVSHPFCLDPGFYAALKHYGPDDHLDTLAFEPCSTVSIEPLLKRVDGYYRPWPADEIRLSNLGAWWHSFTTAACEHESRHPYELPRRQSEAFRADRARAVAAGAFYRSQVIAAGKLYQLFVTLREHGCFRAAGILAAAVYAGRLRRRLGVRRRAIILVPTDKALSGPGGDAVRALLRPGRERELVELISDHVILGKDEIGSSRRMKRLAGQTPPSTMGEEPLLTARGLPAGPLLDLARGAGAPIGVGPFTIYPIDRVVWRHASEPSADAEGMREDRSPPMGAASPNPGTVHGTFAVTRWARRSAFHRLIYHALHIPFLEPFVAVLCPFYFKVPIKNRLRPYRVVRQARNAARLLKQRQGLSGLKAHRAFGLVSNMRRWASRLLSKVRRRAQPHMAPLERLTGLIRRDGLGLAARKIKMRVTGSTSIREAISWLAVSPAEIERLDQVRNYRTLKAVEEVLADFEHRKEAAPFGSEPLVYVRQLLARHRLDGGHGVKAARTLLMKLIEAHPSWADAWLELGFICEDEGALTEALRCFERAMHGKRAASHGPPDPHPGAVAAAHRGRLLMAMGRNDEARAAFALAVSRDPGQKLAAAHYATLLLRSGDIDNALTYYGEGMYYQACRWSLPRPPRNAADIDLLYVAAEALAELPVRRAPDALPALAHTTAEQPL